MKANMNKVIQAIRKRRGLLAFLIVSAIAVPLAVYFWGEKADASDYLTGRAERGDVGITVSATGTVQAVTTVQVGSQASGTVAWLGADFNSQVKRGQVIARLDPTTVEAQIENARANVANAEAAVQAATTEITNQDANVQAAKANYEVARVQSDDAAALANRYKDLSTVIAGRDIESAQAQANVAAGRVVQARAQVAQAEASRQTSGARLQQARAQLAQAKAQLEQAQANLNHTVITSPIDGVVVSRDVDVGQTVAASLSAPTLFTIANDLTKMQVLASIDEADVGQIRQGIKATFTVDAFPGQEFSGQVSQVRLNAQNLQNVVTYTAVIDVSNPELKLRPGMTANITFPVERRENVLTVPNAALRFRPELTEEEQQKLRAEMQARREQRAAERGQSENPQAEGRRRSRGEQQSEAGNAPQQGQGQRAQGQTVWVLVDGKKIEPRFIRAGLT
ncbi:MAG TPA: efflux RND transporter periplasmic adaptor subunit, partial [Blastocatellia bacterium]|nr:efflux RND transporter periplasmic adaptor subunit [Blastocatellia bacterium]